MSSTSRITRMALLGLGALLFACTDSPTEPRTATVIVHLMTPATVAIVTVEVSGPGITPAVVVNIPVGADSVAWDTLTVTAGSGRRFVVTAMDSAGVETHRADTTITLVSGANAPLALRLDPLASTLGITVTFGGVTLSVADTSTRILLVGYALQVAASATEPSGAAVPTDSLRWGSSNPAIFTVTDGLVTPVRGGEAVLSVSHRGTAVRVNIVVVSDSSLSLGLLAYYPLDGNANDASGNGRHGSLVGATASTNRFGVAGSALSFDGVSGSVSSSAEIIELGQEAYAVSIWFSIANYDAWAGDPTETVDAMILSTPHNGLGLTFEMMVSGRMSLALGDASSWVVLYQPGAKSDWAVNTWYHAVFQKEGTTYRVYIDGVLDHELSLAQASSFSSAITLHFGGDNESFGAGSAFGTINGAMDDVRVYGRAISDAEILLLAQDRP